jgi:hypothetical protein
MDVFDKGMFRRKMGMGWEMTKEFTKLFRKIKQLIIKGELLKLQRIPMMDPGVVDLVRSYALPDVSTKKLEKIKLTQSEKVRISRLSRAFSAKLVNLSEESFHAVRDAYAQRQPIYKKRKIVYDKKCA